MESHKLSGSSPVSTSFSSVMNTKSIVCANIKYAIENVFRATFKVFSIEEKDCTWK